MAFELLLSCCSKIRPLFPVPKGWKLKPEQIAHHGKRWNRSTAKLKNIATIPDLVSGSSNNVVLFLFILGWRAECAAPGVEILIPAARRPNELIAVLS